MKLSGITRWAVPVLGLLVLCGFLDSCASSSGSSTPGTGNGLFSPDPPSEPSPADDKAATEMERDESPGAPRARKSDAGEGLFDTGGMDATTSTADFFADTPSASGLKAGFADDNKQFNYFINFLQEYSYVDHFPLPVSERIILKIQDQEGHSLPGVTVRVLNSAGTLLSQGKSYADGTFLFFPSEYPGTKGTLTAEIRAGRPTARAKATYKVVCSLQSPRPESST